jgi:hypothetical protein
VPPEAEEPRKPPAQGRPLPGALRRCRRRSLSTEPMPVRLHRHSHASCTASTRQHRPATAPRPSPTSPTSECRRRSPAPPCCCWREPRAANGPPVDGPRHPPSHRVVCRGLAVALMHPCSRDVATARLAGAPQASRSCCGLGFQLPARTRSRIASASHRAIVIAPPPHRRPTPASCWSITALPACCCVASRHRAMSRVQNADAPRTPRTRTDPEHRDPSRGQDSH